MIKSLLIALAIGISLPAMSAPARAHHVLGIGQSGKSAAGPQIPVAQDIQVGDYLISLAVMPPQPEPGQEARLIFYAKNLRTSKPFLGAMTIGVTAERWILPGTPVLESVQQPIDERFIQIVNFERDGGHTIHSAFTDGGREIEAEFHLDVGTPVSTWKYAAGGFVLAALAWVVWRAMHNRRRPRLV